MSMNEAQENLIKTLEKWQSREPEKTPTWYFANQLHKQLTDLGNDKAGKIVACVSTDFSGLGSDYTEYQEFLDKLSQAAAPVIHKLWVACEKISEEYAVKTMSDIRFWQD